MIFKDLKEKAESYKIYINICGKSSIMI